MPTIKSRRPTWGEGKETYDLRGTIAMVYVPNICDLSLWYDICQQMWCLEVRLTDSMVRRLGIHKGNNFTLDMGERGPGVAYFRTDYVDDSEIRPPVYRNQYSKQEQVDFILRELQNAAFEGRPVRIGLARIDG